MYVLHHDDKPEIYAGLANNPKIADTVALWKGLFKPLSLGGIALAAILASCTTSPTVPPRYRTRTRTMPDV